MGEQLEIKTFSIHSNRVTVDAAGNKGPVHSNPTSHSLNPQITKTTSADFQPAIDYRQASHRVEIQEAIADKPATVRITVANKIPLPVFRRKPPVDDRIVQPLYDGIAKQVVRQL